MKRILVVLIAACGGSPPPPAAPPPTLPVTEVAPPQPTGLSVVDLKFFDGDTPKLVLHANGKLETNTADKPRGKPTWVAIAEVSPDGKIAHDGQPIGELQADGSFVASGKTAPFKLDRDVLVLGDKRVSLSESGTLEGVAGNAVRLRVDGAHDLGARRTALLLLALMVLQP